MLKALLLAVGTLTTQAIASGASAGCVQSSATWQNTSIAAENTAFQASFDATPNRADMDGVTGLSLGPATAYTSLAAIIRFNTNGMIDARNGGNYAAAVRVPYSAGLTYHVRMQINPGAHVYTIYVTPPGSAEITLGMNYAFRSEQSGTSSLNNWAVYEQKGSHTVCNFTATPTSAAPAITSANSGTFTVGTAGTFTVTATGAPKPTLNESGALPSGVTFTASTGVLAGTPAGGTGGSYAIAFTAHNGAGADAVQNFTLTVNQAAVITSGNGTTFSAGTPGTFTVLATGFPAPKLSETGTLPSGVAFSSTTGVLSGTPAGGTGGSYAITFTAHNGAGADAVQNFTLTVNQAAAITSVNGTTFAAGTPGTFTVFATGFPAPKLSETGTLPSGVAFSSTTGVLSGTPAGGTGGSYAITFTAHNGVGTDAVQNFMLTVNQAAAAATPAISPAAGTYASPLTVSITDATPGATIYYTTDGTTPTATPSEHYTAPFALSGSATVNAVAVASGYTNSATASTAYTVTSTACVQSSATWQNTSIAAENTAFQASFDATPNQADMDGVTGLSLGPATAYTSLAVIVRFNTTGFIDARNGGNYAAAVSVPYSAGLTYHVRMQINPGAHVYTIYVTPPGSAEITLGMNYAFRSEQSGTSSLNNWAVYEQQGSHTACNFMPGPNPQPVTLPSSAQVLAAIEKVNNYWISNNTPGNANWTEATYFTGDLAAYDATGQSNYLTFAQTWATSNGYGLCGTACGEGTFDPDYQAAGEAYIRLYQLNNNPTDIAAITGSINGQVNSTQDNLWYLPDDINMSAPSFAELGSIYNNTSYFTKMYALYSYTKYSLGLYDSTTGLWWEDPSYVHTSTYWSRGNGWAFAAHAKILSVLPKSDPHYAEYLSTFTTMAQALAARQQLGGYWNSDLGGTDFAGPESSGTSFFLYGFAWGVNNGILDSATYLPVIENAWSFLSNTAIQPSGLLGYVQPIAGAPGATTATTTEDFGVGAFLLAARQLQFLTH